MRLVGEGEPVIVSRDDALQKAKEQDLDLVEISSNQDPPVVKIIDYSKFRFEQNKKAKEARKKQKIIHVKEIKFRPGIDSHDYQHKVKHAREFLENGDKVKFTVMFRGREIMHTEQGFKIMENVQKDLDDIASVESRPSKEGRNIIMVMGPDASPQKK